MHVFALLFGQKNEASGSRHSLYNQAVFHPVYFYSNHIPHTPSENYKYA